MLSCFATFLILIPALLLQRLLFFLPLVLLLAVNLFLNRKLIRAFYKVSGPYFAIRAVLYYSFIYPVAVGIGAAGALSSHYFGFRS